MENIKKIFISIKDDKLKGMVLLTDKTIEKYGYGESNRVLGNAYDVAINLLKQIYKDELAGLDDQESVNKLANMGKIIVNKKDLVTKLTSYNDGDIENPIKYVFEYGDKKEEIKLEDCYDKEDYIKKISEKLENVFKTYELKVNSDNLEEKLEELSKLGLYEEIDLSKHLDESLNESLDEVEEIKEHKIKNFVVNHKALSALMLAGTILLVTMIPSCSKKNKNNDDVIPLPTANVTVTPTKTLVPTVQPTEVPKIEEIPTLEPVEFFKEIYIVGEENFFNNYEEPSSDILVVKEVNGKTHSMGDGTYDYTFDHLNAVRNANMSSVANKIQSNIKIQDNGTYIYYENRFYDRDIRDKAYVKYFSMIGNAMIKNAYEYQQFGIVNDYAKLSDYEVVRLIRDNVPLHVYICGCEDYICFSELSNEAKEVVLNIAWTNNLPLNKEIINYDGESLNQDNISDIIINQANMLNITK